jgi:hypothetical protein
MYSHDDVSITIFCYFNEIIPCSINFFELSMCLVS